MAKQDETTAEEVMSGDVERVQRDVAGAIASLNDSAAAFYTSIKGNDFESKKLIAKAQAGSEPLADNLNKEIALRNIIVQAVEIIDDETGEVNAAPRVTLITEDGKAFHATSDGLVSAIRNIMATLGEPDTWPEAVPVVATEKRGRRGFRYMTLELV